MMKNFEIKAAILEKCVELQSKTMGAAKQAMNDAQESANEEKGSMEDKFDSFRESMHITRDMYARQLIESTNSYNILKRINPNVEHPAVILGAVVSTDLQNYFISVSIGEIKVGDQSYLTISPQTPLYQALAGKKKGEKFTFRDKTYTITNVF
ncbi:MAG TPA: hypothetical protein VF691_18895 [Cytophagaceae bacterium]|jgi:transcription elongation GreA/GreB family factor